MFDARDWVKVLDGDPFVTAFNLQRAGRHVANLTRTSPWQGWTLRTNGRDVSLGFTNLNNALRLACVVLNTWHDRVQEAESLALDLAGVLESYGAKVPTECQAKIEQILNKGK